jgi:hypothetical protein
MIGVSKILQLGRFVSLYQRDLNKIIINLYNSGFH